MYSIGLDISKLTIDIYIPKNKENIQITNNLQAIKSLYLKLKKQYKQDIDKLIFVFKLTRSYSKLLKRFCSKKDIRCFIVNPKKSINFAKAIGQRNKSDRTMHKYYQEWQLLLKSVRYLFHQLIRQ